jgi:hypothetical protein
LVLYSGQRTTRSGQIISSNEQRATGNGQINNTHFALSYDGQGITSVSSPQDPYHAEFLSNGGRLGQPLVKFKVESGDWRDLSTSARKLEADPQNGALVYTDFSEGSPLKMVQRFRAGGESFDWTIEIKESSGVPVLMGDLAFALPWRFPAGDNPDVVFEKSWTKHHFISGHGSFIYFVRPNGEPPYLVITMLPGTKLEYYTSAGRGSYRAFIHSGYTGNQETRGTWRQEHTYLNLASNSSVTYGFRFRWANSYDEIREILYQEGSFDIRVVPGMTVPEDLSARFSLHKEPD